MTGKRRAAPPPPPWWTGSWRGRSPSAPPSPPPDSTRGFLVCRAAPGLAPTRRLAPRLRGFLWRGSRTQQTPEEREEEFQLHLRSKRGKEGGYFGAVASSCFTPAITETCDSTRRRSDTFSLQVKRVQTGGAKTGNQRETGLHQDHQDLVQLTPQETFNFSPSSLINTSTPRPKETPPDGPQTGQADPGWRVSQGRRQHLWPQRTHSDKRRRPNERRVGMKENFSAELWV